MKVFISWSGETSCEVAKLLSEWIGNVLQGVTCWYSPDDIEKGSLWFNEIGDVLSSSNFGIICLTSENINSPWVLFEAGALFKGLSQSRVCPILLAGHKSADVRPPLSHFNLTSMVEGDMLRLIQTINRHTDSPINEDRLIRTFMLWWPQFLEEYNRIISDVPAKDENPRKAEEMLEEVLDGIRQIQRSLPATRALNEGGLATYDRRPAVSVIQEANSGGSPDYNFGILKIEVLRDTPTATGSGKLIPEMSSVPVISVRLLEKPEGFPEVMMKYSAATGTTFDFNINLRASSYREPLIVGVYVFAYEAKSAAHIFGHKDAAKLE